MPSPSTFHHRIQTAFYLRRAIALVWRSAHGWTLASIALVIVQGILPLVSLYLMKLIVDAVTIGATARVVAFESVAWLIAALGAATVIGAAAQSLATLVGEAQSQNVTDYVQNVIHAQSVKMDLAYYENAAYYDTLHRAQQEAPYRPTRLVNGMVLVAQSGLTLATLAVLLISLHWIIALVLVAAQRVRQASGYLLSVFIEARQIVVWIVHVSVLVVGRRRTPCSFLRS